MTKVDDYSALTDLLTGKTAEKDLRKNLRLELMQKGAVISLAQDGSAEAVAVLAQALASPIEPVRELTLAVLDHLAAGGSQPAVDALCQAAIQDNPPQAMALVISRGYRPETMPNTSLLFLLSGQVDQLYQVDPDLAGLTAAYQSTPEYNRKKVLSAARKNGLDNWAMVVTTLQEATPEALTALINTYPHFKTAKLKNFAIEALVNLIHNGVKAAGEAMSLLFIQTGDKDLGDLAASLGIYPEDQVQRALYYFLNNQWSQYETLDFNHSLLPIAYEAADRAIRQRIIGQARRIGHLEWAQMIGSARQVRWIGDLSDTDWELALATLKQGEKWDDLWRLVQLAPPVWSVRALLILGGSSWQPGFDETGFFETLNRLGANLAGTLPSVQKKTTLTGHLQEITCVALAPNKPLLASASTDQSVRIWDIARGQLSDVLYVTHGQSRSLAFSPDGEFLAIGNSDNSIQIYRLSDHQVIKSLAGHSGTVRSLALSPDGWILASGSFDHTVRLWRFPSGPEIKTLTGHTSEVFCLGISTDGHVLASAGADKVIRLWSLPDGVPLKALEGHASTITCLAASPDGQYIASGGRDNTIMLWTIPEGRLRSAFEPQKNLITCLGIHPDGQVLGSGSYDGSLTLWSASTGKAWLKIAAHQSAVTGLVFSQDGQLMITSGNDRMIQLWMLEDLLLVRLPIEQINLNRLNQGTPVQDKGLIADTNRQWREYTKTLVQWKGRFDIELEEPQRISVGEFDIEL